MRQGGERSRQVPKRLRLTAWKSELAEINAKARQEGMSYVRKSNKGKCMS